MRRIKKTICLLLTVFLLAGGLCTGRASAEEATLSQGQQNIVRRARQLMELQWTPVGNVTMWGGRGTYYAGTTYTGVPYSQPVGYGYIGYEISLDGFLSETKNAASSLYSAADGVPYYGADCSGFISYAWGLAQRHYSLTLPDAAVQIENKIGNLEVGDCLNNVYTHAALVGGITKDVYGNVTSVTVLEQTIPLPKKTVYGEGGTATLAQFESYYFGDGYNILRNPYRDSVTYTHSCAVPLAGDVCELCGCGMDETAIEAQTAELPFFADVPADAWYYNAVEFVCSQGLFKGTGAAEFDPDGTMTRGMFLTTLGRLAGIPEGLTGRIGACCGNDVNVRSGPGTENGVLCQLNRGALFSVLEQSPEPYGWSRISFGSVTGYMRNDYISCYDGAFRDLDETAYYSPYVQWAYLSGIAKGGDGAISAEADLKREDLAALLYRYAVFSGAVFDEENEPVTFTDEDSISVDKRDAVYALQRCGILSGMEDGSFAPTGSATRAQVAQILQNFLCP